MPTLLPNCETRVSITTGLPDVRVLLGYCDLGSPDAALLVSRLSHLVHIRGEKRLTTLLELVGDEFRAQRPARDIVLSHLLEVLFIEALRSSAGTSASSGLLRGLADERVATALRRMHENPERSWMVPLLAKEAALSRSTFFERFRRSVGFASMEYLFVWRMALAKEMLRRNEGSVAEVAALVGYSSASTFTIAFTRHVGQSPGRYGRDVANSLDTSEQQSESRNDIYDFSKLKDIKRKALTRSSSPLTLISI